VEPWLDTRFEPLIVQIFPAEYTYEDIDAGFTKFETYCLTRARREPTLRIAVISDLSLVKSSNARNRSRLTQSYQTLSEPMERYTIGQALIVPRAVLRHAMTAVFWVKRPRFPIRAFARQTEALRWLSGLFEAEGRKMPTPSAWWLGQDVSDFEDIDVEP
jgi:hypothetical protein